ncbi:MAG: ribosome small subunit-dependent GTPase A [Coriobacteriia bacterium]|nr:ribosome small subunit-dependent GTPase A [Coriobacteriia bacterium]
MQLSGQLITLDRTLPLVRIDGVDQRAEYAASFSVEELKATVGDYLDLVQSSDQDLPQIIGIKPRETLLARRLCREHPSVGEGLIEEHFLAANFDQVVIVEALGKRDLDLDYLEKQLVAAYESGGRVTVALNKLDLFSGSSENEVKKVQELAEGLSVVAVSALTGQGMPGLFELCPPQTMTVFFGRSGVGKSSLINALIGSPDLATGKTREKDQAGRHTTVARRIVFADERGYYDTPGVRTIGNYLHEAGLFEVFADVIELAAQCKFRDCRHAGEPECAVLEAINSQTLSTRRLNSYLSLAAEVAGDDVLT